MWQVQQVHEDHNDEDEVMRGDEEIMMVMVVMMDMGMR